MTDEMYNVIYEYCDRHSCSNCLIREQCIGCDCIWSKYPDLISDAYNIITKDGFDEDKPDNVNHPSHYTQGGMECIDEMVVVFGKEAVKNFCLCNVWKYRKRALFKNGQEDLDKSDWYMKKYKELCDLE